MYEYNIHKYIYTFEVINELYTNILFFSLLITAQTITIIVLLHIIRFRS